MNTKINLQTILIVFMLCVTVILTTNTYAIAQVGVEDKILLGNAPESEITLDPVPDGPGFIMVSAFDFKPFAEDHAQAYMGTALYNPSDTLTTDSVAGLTLPHGATITKVTLYFLDNSSDDASSYLLRGTAEGNYEVMTNIDITGAQADYRTATNSMPITNPKVDNQNYSYFLGILIPANTLTNIKISNVRIDYAYTVYTPTIMK